MNKIFATITALALPVGAAAEAYSCETTNFGRGGWVPPNMILTYDVNTGSGTVYDGFIKSIREAPIPVEVQLRSDTSFVFRWKLKGLKSANGGTGTNSYKVTLFTDRNQFTLSGRRHGYDNIISASGSCKRER